LVASYEAICNSLDEVAHQQGVEETVNQPAKQAQETSGQAAEQAQEVAVEATEQVEEVAGEAQGVAGQATEQAQGLVGQVTDQAGEAVGEATQAVEGLAPGTQLLSETTNELGQTVQRTVDESGDIVETTLDESGNLVLNMPLPTMGCPQSEQILAARGEQGTGKSTTTAELIQLTDRSQAPLGRSLRRYRSSGTSPVLGRLPRIVSTPLATSSSRSPPSHPGSSAVIRYASSSSYRFSAGKGRPRRSPSNARSMLRTQRSISRSRSRNASSVLPHRKTGIGWSGVSGVMGQVSRSACKVGKS
jgi:hypothetical protein